MASCAAANCNKSRMSVDAFEQQELGEPSCSPGHISPSGAVLGEKKIDGRRKRDDDKEGGRSLGTPKRDGQE